MVTLKDQKELDLESVFFNTDEFADDFVFSRTSLTVPGNFRDEFVDALMAGGVGIEASALSLTVATVNVPGIVHGDTFTRVTDSVVFTVTSAHQMTNGKTLIFLSSG